MPSYFVPRLLSGSNSDLQVSTGSGHAEYMHGHDASTNPT